MGRKRICRADEDVASPPPKRGKRLAAETSSGRRKVLAGRGKARVRKHAPDLDLPNENLEFVQVTDNLYIKKAWRRCSYDVHPPKAKDYTRNLVDKFLLKGLSLLMRLLLLRFLILGLRLLFSWTTTILLFDLKFSQW